MTSIAVAGASGYVGGEILRLLVDHPRYRSGELSLGAVTAGQSAGEVVGRLQRHLASHPDVGSRVITATTAHELKGVDVVFCALPHGHSAALINSLPPGVMVIDCGADFRINNSDLWHRYYEGAHAGSWPYGLPELPGAREAIAVSSRVAVPGCFPTAAILALWPICAGGAITPRVTITAISGSSGAGKSTRQEMTSAEIIGSIRAYNIAGAHRHNAEIQEQLSQVYKSELEVIFTPVIAPVTRGILAICTVETHKSEVEIAQIYQQAYANEPCVTCLEPGLLPRTKDVVGSNAVQIGWQHDARSRVLTVVCAIDNLTKGTAGAAWQCFNLMNDIPETSGLPLSGVAP